MRAQVACSLVSGDLPITITWRKDGGPLVQDPDVQEQQLGFVSNLLFGNLAGRHAGEYTCIASNAAAVTNATAVLTVKGMSVFFFKSFINTLNLSCGLLSCLNRAFTTRNYCFVN